MKDNTETKNLIREAVEKGDMAGLEQSLMQDAIDSGELTKAFASAWANRAVGGQGEKVPDEKNAQEGNAQASSSAKFLPSFRTYSRKGSGVHINGGN